MSSEMQLAVLRQVFHREDDVYTVVAEGNSLKLFRNDRLVWEMADALPSWPTGEGQPLATEIVSLEKVTGLESKMGVVASSEFVSVRFVANSTSGEVEMLEGRGACKREKVSHVISVPTEDLMCRHRGVI